MTKTLPCRPRHDPDKIETRQTTKLRCGVATTPTAVSTKKITTAAKTTTTALTTPTTASATPATTTTATTPAPALSVKKVFPQESSSRCCWKAARTIREMHATTLLTTNHSLANGSKEKVQSKQRATATNDEKTRCNISRKGVTSRYLLLPRRKASALVISFPYYKMLGRS